MTSFYDKFETLPEIGTNVSETFDESNDHAPADELNDHAPAEESNYIVSETSEAMFNLEKDKSLINMHCKMYCNWDTHKYNLFMMGYINYYTTIIRNDKYSSPVIYAIFMEKNEFVYYSAHIEKYKDMISYYAETDILSIISKMVFESEDDKKKYADECVEYLGKGWQCARAHLDIRNNQISL